jgi:hypothetical protein
VQNPKLRYFKPFELFEHTGLISSGFTLAMKLGFHG